MTAVTFSNLISEPRTQIVSLVSDTSKVPDPVSGSAEFRKHVYSREPDVKDSEFKGYPFMIVHPSQFESLAGGSLDGRKKFVTWSIEVEIITSDRAYGQLDGKGLEHLDSISNNILKTLFDFSNRSDLFSNNLKMLRPVPTSVSVDVIANQLVYRRSIMVNFQNRIKVSN